jgi:hypothetical protein
VSVRLPLISRRWVANVDPLPRHRICVTTAQRAVADKKVEAWRAKLLRELGALVARLHAVAFGWVCSVQALVTGNVVWPGTALGDRWQVDPRGRWWWTRRACQSLHGDGACRDEGKNPDDGDTAGRGGAAASAHVTPHGAALQCLSRRGEIWRRSRAWIHIERVRTGRVDRVLSARHRAAKKRATAVLGQVAPRGAEGHAAARRRPSRA